MAVKVRLKDGSNNVLHPETDWSVVLSRPSIKLRYYDGSHDTASDSQLNEVIKATGTNSEAWDTYSDGTVGIVIGNRYNALGLYGSGSPHPRTSLTSKNAVSITANANVTIASPQEVVLTGKNIRVATKDTNNNGVLLADYPINWTALNGRPFDEFLNLKNYNGSSTAQSSIENAVFGTYYIVTPGSIPTTMYYPAFAIVSQKLVGGALQAERTKGYYLNASGALTEITDMEHFSGLLDYRKNNQ